MLLLAVTAFEKLQTLPKDVWLKVGTGIAIFVGAIFLLRRILKMNKIIAGIIVFVGGTVFFFSLVFNRNEPQLLTPIVEKIAPFFPSAGAYNAKQATTPK